MPVPRKVDMGPETPLIERMIERPPGPFVIVSVDVPSPPGIIMLSIFSIVSWDLQFPTRARSSFISGVGAGIGMAADGAGFFAGVFGLSSAQTALTANTVAITSSFFTRISNEGRILAARPPRYTSFEIIVRETGSWQGSYSCTRIP